MAQVRTSSKTRDSVVIDGPSVTRFSAAPFTGLRAGRKAVRIPHPKRFAPRRPARCSPAKWCQRGPSSAPKLPRMLVDFDHPTTVEQFLKREVLPSGSLPMFVPDKTKPQHTVP